MLWEFASSDELTGTAEVRRIIMIKKSLVTEVANRIHCKNVASKPPGDLSSIAKPDAISQVADRDCANVTKLSLFAFHRLDLQGGQFCHFANPG
jgi:hypothetical protein